MPPHICLCCLGRECIKSAGADGGAVMLYVTGNC